MSVGAGKSATRLTVFKELWAKKAAEQKVPLAVNMTDFGVAIRQHKIHECTEEKLIREVAFSHDRKHPDMAEFSGRG